MSKKQKCKVLIDYVVKEEDVPDIVKYMIDTKGVGTISTVPLATKPPEGPVAR